MEATRAKGGARLVGRRIRALGSSYRKMGRSAAVQAVCYIVLLALSFIFVLPVLYMIATSFKSLENLLDSTIVWIPDRIYWPNFAAAARGLRLDTAFRNTLYVSVLASVG